jgi:DNA-directed RNA polymerase specialized sigma24 family protein
MRKDHAVGHADAALDQALCGPAVGLVDRPARTATLPRYGYTIPARASCWDAIQLSQDELYDLFRRAVVGGDQWAWEALYARYERLVGGWLRRHTAATQAGESLDYLINRTFERFWLYVTPDRFGSFQGLPALLQYLKLCAHGVLLDDVRSRVRRQAIYGRVGVGAQDVVEVEDRELAHELWQAVRAVAHEEAEYIVAILAFVQGVKPREIHRLHPDRFASVADVYRIKRNLLERLRRDAGIRLLCG